MRMKYFSWLLVAALVTTLGFSLLRNPAVSRSQPEPTVILPEPSPSSSVMVVVHEPTQNAADPTVKPRSTHNYPLINVAAATEERRSSGVPFTKHCESAVCQTLADDYQFEGIYGFYSEEVVDQLGEALESYALLMGKGDLEAGQEQFALRVSGPGGFQRIEFVKELLSGRSSSPFARFAPEVGSELTHIEPDVFAVWCPPDHVIGVCDAYDIPSGTILVDVSTAEHSRELSRTVAHELTHALDTKSGYEARRQFELSGAAAVSPVADTSLQENFAETIALWFFPRTGNPGLDWNPRVVAFVYSYLTGEMELLPGDPCC